MLQDAEQVDGAEASCCRRRATESRLLPVGRFNELSGNTGHF